LKGLPENVDDDSASKFLVYYFLHDWPNLLHYEVVSGELGADVAEGEMAVDEKVTFNAEDELLVLFYCFL
jgi:hypothetical protein